MPLPCNFTLKDGRTALIRQANPGDAEGLLAHVNEITAEGIFLQTERVDKSAAEEMEWISGFDGLSKLLIVAEVDHRLVGSADIRRGPQVKNAHVAELGIALSKGARGQGLGRAIIEAMIDWARSVGIRKLFLGVFHTNERAIALYRVLGFEDEGRLRGQVILEGQPADLVLMSRWI